MKRKVERFGLEKIIKVDLIVLEGGWGIKVREERGREVGDIKEEGR